ncbi:MAG: hypothetical protein H6738_01100 [Alphaproteobacteria bacterium]|nr:hypothetical protein [Alphaproteobacteria bacterium]
MTLDRVVDRGTDYGDTGKVCALGSALVHPLGSLTKNEPHRALVIAEGTAALCAEEAAWEGELDAARVKHNAVALGDGRAPEITDARLRAERAHTLAAARFEAAFRQAEEAFGPIGTGDCPKIKEKDEFAYLFALVSGTLALLHDRSGGAHNEVPMDRLSAVARGAACLDDADWWSAPSALQGASWATIPGSGPADVDPWAMLDEAAARGEASGVRVARAIEVLIAANNGRDDILGPALRAHAASLQAVDRNDDWALLDAYAYEVSLQQSDALWTAETGHRTETFGKLPGDDAPTAPVGPDPFAGGDPFGAPAPEPEPPNPEETP